MTGHASPIQATYFNHTMTMDNNTSDNRRDPDSRQEPENYRNPEGSTPKAHSPTHPSFETLAIHADRTLSPREPGAPVVYPAVSSTVFRMAPEEQEDELIYTRLDNPNRRQLEAVLAALEGGEGCAVFGSGMAASTAIMQTLEPGARILIPRDIYHGTRKLMTTYMVSWGVEVTEVDMTDPGQVEEAVDSRTRLLWVESPSNPLLQIVDIRKLSRICKEHGLLLVVDNTWPSPINQQPLKLGADLVMHSTSKYIGGHSDLLGGAVIAARREGVFEKIADIQRSLGAVPSPNDCWLMLRSVRTLPYRMRAHNENAGIVARFLERHPSVKELFYPGLEHHPGHEIAREQMYGFGGMISFRVDGDREATARVVQASRLIAPVTSLGGVESTWEHRIRTEGSGGSTPEDLIRLSVGLENPDDLVEDIGQALSAL